MIYVLIAFAGLLVWLYLIALHGGFWRLTERDRNFPPPGAQVPAGSYVIAVTPARDEVDVIATSVGSLLRQNFPGRFDLVLVDDESTDGTSEKARASAASLGAADRLTVLSSDGPGSGWTGKLAAMNRGFEYVRALPEQPDFVLFCDADIAFGPDVLARLVAGAAARGTVLSSLMVKLRCESVAEKWFVPAFVFFFQMLYPFRRVNNPKSKVAAAAGGVMLVRPEALAMAGGLAAIRNALIDDCALGALMKKHGPIWLGLTDDVHSLRAYPHFADIEKMVVRSAYAQLGYSPLQLVGAVLGMFVVYLAPPVLGLLGGLVIREMAIFAWIIMALAYMPSLKFYGLSRFRAFALPGVAACYTWFTIESAIRHIRGQGGEWKGRYQAPAKSGV